jgi:hypothetical protein
VNPAGAGVTAPERLQRLQRPRGHVAIGWTGAHGLSHGAQCLCAEATRG